MLHYKSIQVADETPIVWRREPAAGDDLERRVKAECEIRPITVVDDVT